VALELVGSSALVTARPPRRELWVKALVLALTIEAGSGCRDLFFFLSRASVTNAPTTDQEKTSSKTDSC